MALFWKATAGVLIAVILALFLGQNRKDMALMLSMAVCCMACILALIYLEPVMEFLRELESLGDLQGDMLGILLKAVGIGMVAEIAALICTDAGQSSLGKSIQLLGSIVILCLSLPILRSMLELVQKILGEI